MNVPAIRKALERMITEIELSPVPPTVAAVAVVRVGLRACDEWEQGVELRAASSWYTMVAIADILREAGVEVEK